MQDNQVNPCAHLSSVYDLSPSKKERGIFHLTLENLSDERVIRTMFIVKSGEKVERGLILNFCPFCGERIFEDGA